MNKKLLLIFATLFLVFTFFSVSAYCCEKTNEGSLCQDDIKTNCNASFDSSPTSCESTSYCELGTCVDLNQGICSPNTPVVACEEINGHWEKKSMEEVAECQLGGCFLGNDCTFVTNAKCKILSSEYGLTTDFRPSVDTREKCDILSNPDVEGACVFEEGYSKKCVRLTKKQCDDDYKSNPNYENVEFHKNYLCTHEDLNTICGKSSETTCEEGKVHYIDTCGNIANIYDKENLLDDDYWNEIIKPKNSCKLEWNNELGKFTNADECGNCDYLEGSICKPEQMGVKNEADLGNNVCAELSCEYKGKTYRNGERWCYSNAVEGQENSPGAEYAVLSCIDSEVISEPCDAFRQEICIENINDGYHFANCKENYWKDCLDFETEDECTNPNYDCQWLEIECETELQEVEGPYEDEEYPVAKEYCGVISEALGTKGEDVIFAEDDYNRGFFKWEGDYPAGDGYISPSSINANFIHGYCVPKNAPGSAFWGTEEKNVCSNVKLGGYALWKNYWEYSRELQWGKSIYQRRVINNIAYAIGKNEGYWEYEKNNEIILRDSFKLKMEKICSSYGDCGPNFNFYGIENYSRGINYDIRSDKLKRDLDWMWGWVAPENDVEKLEFITIVTCEPWQAPRGGEDCELCNNQEIPCTEYQCHALGQGCGTMKDNDGETICYDANKDDVTPPQITLINDLPDGFEYDNKDFLWPDNTISFPNNQNENGVKLIHPELADGNINSGRDCLPYNKEFDITIHTDEPANCKYHYERTFPTAGVKIEEVFDKMMDKKFNQRSGNMYNHTAQFRLMNYQIVEESEYNSTIKPNEDHNIFIRCMDGNGNVNMNEFEVSFCIDDQPDVIAPVIDNYDIENGGFIGYGLTSVNVTFTLDDASPPCECKWDTMEKTYDNMINNMSCSGYDCIANFTGIISNGPTENKFFIRCKDYFNNTMTESIEYSLFGSLPLGISSAEPNNTKISGASDEVELTLEVKTFGGAENGKATCYFDGVKFHETKSDTHSQPSYQAGVGNHTIKIKCKDAGGNLAIKNISFEIEQDESEPIVTRAFKQSGYLRLMTNEPAQCVYSTTDCNYGFSTEGIINISTTFEEEHNIVWDSDKDFYIKCKDKYNNIPEDPEDCTITIKPSVTFD